MSEPGMSAIRESRYKTVVIICVITVALTGFGFLFSKISGCFAGGGGSTHQAPAIVKDQPIVLELGLSRWAAPECLSGQVTDDYSEVRCHYRHKGEASYKTIDMNVSRIDDKNHAYYECTIPYPRTPTEIEYYFDLKMNGVYSRDDEKALAIQ